MDRDSVLAAISPPVDRVLAEALVDEFVAGESRYLLGDWEPATLDGGQFAEVAARIVYHIDSGNLNRRKSVDACLKYVEDLKSSNAHSFPQRRAALHLAKIIRAIYKFRSQRGAVHIDPDYSANELDSGLVVAQMRWVLSEILRLFWTRDRSAVARAIREVIRFEVPSVLFVDGAPYVVRTDCTIEEEILLLVHSAGEDGLTSEQIANGSPRSSPSIRAALSKLKGATKRQVILRADGTYTLTANGSKRLHEEIGVKLASR